MDNCLDFDVLTEYCLTHQNEHYTITATNISSVMHCVPKDLDPYKDLRSAGSLPVGTASINNLANFAKLFSLLGSLNLAMRGSQIP